MKRLAICLVALSLGVSTVDAEPIAPGNLTASVTGTTVTLSWSAPLGAILGYRLEAGTGPGLSNVANTTIGLATSFSAPSVPAGTYYVRVRAIAAEGESLPSNEVTVVVGAAAVPAGCAGPPAAPLNLRASLNGTAVHVSWTTGDGCPATNHVLQAGSAPGLANLAVVNTGAMASLTVTAPPGTYYIRVIAQNAFGTSAPSNEVNIGVGGSTTTMAPLAGTINADVARLITVTMPSSGRYQATLTWHDPADDLDLYLATVECLFYPPLPCMLAVSMHTAGNMEQVSRSVQAGQRYALWIDNYSMRPVAYSIQHMIMAADVAAADAPEQDDRMPPPVITKSHRPPK
jgi:predicted phage tail protein